jgi:hypothetical protein
MILGVGIERLFGSFVRVSSPPGAPFASATRYHLTQQSRKLASNRGTQTIIKWPGPEEHQDSRQDGDEIAYAAEEKWMFPEKCTSP